MASFPINASLVQLATTIIASKFVVVENKRCG
jgi:hypothetical protein